MSSSDHCVSFPHSVSEKLQHYVYAYYDPANTEKTSLPFYVGKGIGDRVFAHLKEAQKVIDTPDQQDASVKIQNLTDILQRGDSPIIKIVRHGLATDKEAVTVEAALIDCLRPHLSNVQGGHYSQQLGIIDVQRLITLYDDQVPAATFSHLDAGAILVNLNRSFKNRLQQGDNLDTLFSPLELYDATRMAWRMNGSISTQGDKAVRYAFAVYRNKIMEAYRVAAWLPAGSTLRHDGNLLDQSACHKRMEFVGSIAEDTLRKEFVGKKLSEKDAWSKGQANPIKFIRTGGMVEVEALAQDANDSVEDTDEA